MSNDKHVDHDQICDHKVKWCKKCDVTYCEYNGCSREWPTTESCMLQHYPWYITTTPTYDKTWTSKVSVDDDTLYASECFHN